MATYCSFFLGQCTHHGIFEIYCGQKALLLNIAKWIKAKVNRGGPIDDYSSFAEENYGKQDTTRSAIEQLFVYPGFNEQQQSAKAWDEPTGETVAVRAKFPDVPALYHIQLKAFVIDSCLLRLKNTLKSHVLSNPNEIEFMQSCGVFDLDESKLEVTIGDAEFRTLLDVEDIKTSRAKVMVRCYCRKHRANTVVTIYFRPSNKWHQIRNGHIININPVEEMSSSWNCTNFIKHLESHQKCLAELDPEGRYRCELLAILHTKFCLHLSF